MAKAEKVTENVPAELEAILEGLSPEDRAELLRMTGQANNQSFDKTPTLKPNRQHKADVNGKTIPFGNWCVNQVIKKDGTKKTIEEIGVDLGENAEVTIFKVAKQYGRYVEGDKNASCTSNLILEPGDKPVGNNFGFNCSSKDNPCPYRDKEKYKQNACTCQHVNFLTTSNNTPAILYVKGSNYMEWQKYLDSFGTMPYFGFKTIIKKEEASRGDVDYFLLYPEKGAQVSAIEFKENFEMAKAVNKNVQGFEADRKARNQKQLGHKQSGSTEGLGFDSSAGSSKGAAATDAEIVFN